MDAIVRHGDDGWQARWPLWAAALALGVMAVGGPWGDGALVNLDLIAVADLGVPDSLLGLGPEIPRRAPVQAIWALLSPPLSAAAATRVWMILIVAVAAAGTHRSLADIRRPIAAGAAVLYAWSPFLLTRLAVGHLGFATAVALLPWAFPTLVEPLNRPRRTLGWLAGFALCGYFGALIAGPVVLVGLAATGRRPTPLQACVGAASQIPWLAPAAVALGDATGAAGARRFDTDVDTLADAVRLLVGFGFWRTENQLGIESAVSVLIAALLAVLSFAGLRYAAVPHRRPTVVLAVVGLAIALAGRLPLVDDLFDSLTEFVLFAPLREGQRLLAFTVFAMIALGARGLDLVLAERGRPTVAAASVGLVGAALVLSGTALWGLDGAATDHEIPDSWWEARSLVMEDDATVLALPWSQYFDVEIADDRRGHNPIPFLIGGDVISSHDLGLGAEEPIGRDPRETEALTFVRSLRFGLDVRPLLADLGVDWIVALPDLGTGDIDLLREAAGVTIALDSPEVAVFLVDRIDASSGIAPLTDWTATATILLTLHLAWLVGLMWLVVARSRPDQVKFG